MSRRRVTLGQQGEKAALKFFEDLGYQLLEANYRNRAAEADLILQDGKTLVFCEVKTKIDLASGHAAESYGKTQQRRLRRLILGYLARTDWQGPVRIDLLALQREKPGQDYQLYHFIDALTLEDNW